MRIVAIMLIAAVLLSASIAAHERRTYEIGGQQYHFTVGTLGEPALIGDKAGLDMRVKHADPLDPQNSSAPNATPVVGLEKTLKLQLISGESEKTQDIQAAWKDPGAYVSYFIPTSHMISYRIFGEIEGNPVNIRFDCSSEGHNMHGGAGDTSATNEGDAIRLLKAGAFGCITPREEMQFPAQGSSVAMMDPAHHEMMMHTMDMQGEAQHRTETLAFAGMIAGVLGLIVGGIALARR